MSDSFFEVEHSTNIFNSLLKFSELRDFYANFYIVADNFREREILNKSALSTFKEMSARVKFFDYQTVSSWNAKVHELSIIENSITLT